MSVDALIETDALIERGALSALLPVKVSGRHYGDNLARLDLLFSSVLHFAAPGMFGEILIVVPADEADYIGRHLENWPELPIRLVIEDEHFPAFRRFTRPWQIRPWQRQQIIKLNAPAIASGPFVLMLDPDVLAVKPINYDFLIRDGRAVLEPEPRTVHRRWWLDSSALLGVDPGLDRQGIGVTPAILSTEIISEVQSRLEAVSGRPWMDTLLTSYCDWTEFTLYLLGAESSGLLDKRHIWADDPAVPHRLQVDPDTSIWDAGGASVEAVQRLFTAVDPGLFAVVQGGTMSAGEVAGVVEEQFAVRRIPCEPFEASAGAVLKRTERIRTASRLVAQALYRLRRQVRT